MVERELNWFGVSIETIAAWYETDQALRENGGVINDYVNAAISAENMERRIDAALQNSD